MTLRAILRRRDATKSLRIAYFSPLNPRRSGISDYSEELLPELGQLAQLDVYVDDFWPTNSAIVDRFPILDDRSFDAERARDSYDLAVYQIGNSPLHASIFRTLERIPGITVLHDWILHHAIVEMTVAEGDPGAYVREMAYAHGRPGMDSARAALRDGTPFPYLDFAVNRRVLDASLGVIVHSEYVRSLVRAQSPETHVTVVQPHVSLQRRNVDVHRVRDELGIPPDTLLIGSFGLATVEKRLDVALRAFRSVRAAHPKSRYVIVGDASPSVNLAAMIRELDLADSVTVTGYVTRVDLLRYIAAVDVGVNLRWPTMGETSAVLLRLFAAGKPTIVSDVGAFSEFPDRVCLKIAVNAAEEITLTRHLLGLAADPDRRRVIGQDARSYVEEFHSPQATAAGYVQFIESILK